MSIIFQDSDYILNDENNVMHVKAYASGGISILVKVNGLNYIIESQEASKLLSSATKALRDAVIFGTDDKIVQTIAAVVGAIPYVLEDIKEALTEIPPKDSNGSNSPCTASQANIGQLKVDTKQIPNLPISIGAVDSLIAAMLQNPNRLI